MFSKKPFPLGALVKVHDMGTHYGQVVGFDPVITIQGRSRIAKGWVTVELDGSTPAPKPVWNGSPEFIAHIAA